MADEVKLSELSADDIEEMIRENYAGIFRYCFWRTKQRSDAEDLTQETFCVLSTVCLITLTAVSRKHCSIRLPGTYVSTGITG